MRNGERRGRGTGGNAEKGAGGRVCVQRRGSRGCFFPSPHRRGMCRVFKADLPWFILAGAVRAALLYSPFRPWQDCGVLEIGRSGGSESHPHHLFAANPTSRVCSQRAPAVANVLVADGVLSGGRTVLSGWARGPWCWSCCCGSCCCCFCCCCELCGVVVGRRLMRSKRATDRSHWR
jgi:hypothetical protein